MSKITESPNTNSKYEKIISNLPQDDGWKPVGNLYKYQGFWYGPSLLRNVISAQESFTPHPSDVVLCSSPKSGTAWLKALAFSIVSRNQVNDSTNPLLKKLPHEIVPFLEIELAQDSNNRNLEIPFDTIESLHGLQNLPLLF
ncbi:SULFOTRANSFERASE [Salix viminalis]|uniref:Sulfotransferase n=1 Tax=Salix viminalis TaxID=40686 RepID=A0A9Q0NN24_SALVM|nr:SULFOTRANSFERASE [Salix viminalis]